MRRRSLRSLAAVALAMLMLAGVAAAEKPSRPSSPASGPPAVVPAGPPPARPPGPPPGRPPGPPPSGGSHYVRHYPPPGHVVPALPHGYHVAHHHHYPYYYGGGVWYRPYGPYFRVIAPPLGVTVAYLPDFYTTLWFGGVPYYYANSVYYLRRTDGPGYVVTEPPAGAAGRGEPQAAASSDEIFVYPRAGQTEDRQARDRYDCHRWAVEQTGFDPSLPGGGVPDSQNAPARDEYRRAITACLEGRGYTVR